MTALTENPTSTLVGILDTTVVSTTYRTTSAMIGSAEAPTYALRSRRLPHAVIAARPERLRRIAAGLPSLAAEAAHRRAAVIEQDVRHDSSIGAAAWDRSGLAAS